jgi:16S rRNA (uracil1498-N3)-methyltransferase
MSMPPRLFLDQPLQAGATLSLPPGPARHVQVLRLQPGDALTLFDGLGGEWSAAVLRMGRSDVQVVVGTHDAVDREPAWRVTLAIGMPANERMDALIEKATELGVAVVQPLICERSVLRLAGERAQKKVEHWRGVAVAASEQSGRTRVPHVADVLTLPTWLASPSADRSVRRVVLSLRDAAPLAAEPPASAVCFLSGPEGGLSDAEESMARQAGFAPVSLGPRVLRADTAPLAALAAWTIAPR